MQYKFQNTPGDWQSKQWWDMRDEHFVVWMRTAGLPNFRKLWGHLSPATGKPAMKKGFY